MPFVAIALLIIFMIGASVIIDFAADTGRAIKSKFSRQK